MRYCYCFIVSILLCLPITAETSVLKKAELRVLDIGNSYTTGATRLLPLITTASKTDLSTMCLYQCYRSGASFKKWVDIYNDKVIRSSQGAIFKLSFIHSNLKEFILNHKEYKFYGTNVVIGISIEEVENTKLLGIVLGNEGNGISKETDSVLEKNIYIPMNNTESLNVSVAGGIIMYELRS